MTDMITIKFAKSLTKSIPLLVIPVFETGKTLSIKDKNCSDKLNKMITTCIKNQNSFKAKLGQTLNVPIAFDDAPGQIVLLGLGLKKDLKSLKAEEAGGKLYAAIHKFAAKAALSQGALSDEQCAHVITGLSLRGYHFDKYKTPKKDAPKTLDTLSVITDNTASIKKIFEPLKAVIDGTFWARDLVNEPPNTLFPASYAKQIKDTLKPLGVQVEIIDAKKMEKLGMGCALAVGQGSDQPPCMVVMRWNGGKKSDKPVSFVGKGVTFDTGGISLKPGPNMDEMKMDMGGSAAVVGLIKTLALRGAKANVVAIVGLVENMPSARAYRPGDIITSYAGKTVEILNTDAEGRLVLVDALAYVQDKYKPKMIINLATLTGAMMVALGHEHCGAFVNNDDLWTAMNKASATTGEKLWRMPLDAHWRKDVESDVADLRNLGSSRYGGACSAAAFLEHFIENNTPWSHMDIAGTAWRKSDKPTSPKFASGYGVRLLDQLVADCYEG